MDKSQPKCLHNGIILIVIPSNFVLAKAVSQKWNSWFDKTNFYRAMFELCSSNINTNSCSFILFI